MKKFIAMVAATALLLTGCEQLGGKSKTARQTSDFIGNNVSEINIDQVLPDQKIVFMMWIASYDEPYSSGYFIDGKGMKHIYKRSDVKPMYSVDVEYAYLLEHYDEFETTAYFDDATLKKCTECLYQVNANAEVRTEGKAIADAPEKKLYGVRMIDGHEEFVFLGSEPGIVKRLDDAASDQIFELFGDKWYLQ